MSEIAIKVENLSKLYRLGEIGTNSLSDDFQNFLSKIRGKVNPAFNYANSNEGQVSFNQKYLWALKDMSFEIKKGQAIGIVGKNGAGKSTLLKILSRITSPTKGKVIINGSLASLLEVGTGMHPELTARENIFLNGLILGMSKSDVKRNFDNIVDFAGVHKFVDTPVKRFSSGMRVKLGFAVAAFLEPDIMIIDEVLAVGDREFTKKAIDKIRDVSYNSGSTALFVSHNMQSIKKLCDTTMLFKNGKLVEFGNTDDVILNYISQGNTVNLKHRELNNEEIGINSINKILIELNSKSDKSQDSIPNNETIKLRLEYTCNSLLSSRLDFRFRFKQEDGSYLFNTSTDRLNNSYLKNGVNSLNLEIPPYFFNPGVYYIDFFIFENQNNLILRKMDFLYFTIKSSPGDYDPYNGKFKTHINLEMNWEVNK